mmetsp:Transcript_20101/g.35429  ORF Transcript_20101/g.35429 Transcript_20101/m.35429 type:complete len:388 (+) Transcript_20101:26-1189(+)
MFGCLNCCSWTGAGPILLSFSYVLYVILIEYLVPVDCLDEPCNSEGLDNSILGWATDYFIAILITGFGLDLCCKTKRFCCRTVQGTEGDATCPSVCPAVLSLWFMGAAYVFGGLGHSVYTNSGFDDNAGQQGFYISWAVSFTFMTLSVEETYRFVRSVMAPMTSSSSRCCRRTGLFLNISLVLVIAAWIATAGGYVWCATNEDLHVEGPIDSVPPGGGDDNDNIDGEDNDSFVLEQCLQVAAPAEITWYVCFSLFWIPAGMILRSTILEKQQQQVGGRQLSVFGFPVAWAAIWVSVIPWTFGIMIIVYSGIAAVATGQEATQVYEDIYGAVIYHYGMLLGYFFFHNIVLSLTSREDGEGNQPGNGTDVSNKQKRTERHSKTLEEDSC